MQDESPARRHLLNISVKSGVLHGQSVVGDAYGGVAFTGTGKEKLSDDFDSIHCAFRQFVFFGDGFLGNTPWDIECGLCTAVDSCDMRDDSFGMGAAPAELCSHADPSIHAPLCSGAVYAWRYDIAAVPTINNNIQANRKIKTPDRRSNPAQSRKGRQE